MNQFDVISKSSTNIISQEETTEDQIASFIPSSHEGILKGRPLETLNISDTAFEQVSKLCIEMQFDH
jgi:hypothetical protein